MQMMIHLCALTSCCLRWYVGAHDWAGLFRLGNYEAARLRLHRNYMYNLLPFGNQAHPGLCIATATLASILCTSLHAGMVTSWVQVSWPRTRHYWGYVWDGTGARTTAPIRNPLNKSHMPDDQYPLDYYPPFCSGCGFVLSWDLVQALVAQPLPDYRLLVRYTTTSTKSFLLSTTAPKAACCM
jgi:hypothetical protein